MLGHNFEPFKADGYWKLRPPRRTKEVKLPLFLATQNYPLASSRELLRGTLFTGTLFGRRLAPPYAYKQAWELDNADTAGYTTPTSRSDNSSCVCWDDTLCRHLMGLGTSCTEGSLQLYGLASRRFSKAVSVFPSCVRSTDYGLRSTE